MRMRFECLPEEVESVVAGLKKGFRVIEVSKPYQNRNSEMVRIYVTVRIL